MTVQPWGAANCDFALGNHPAGGVSNPARALLVRECVDLPWKPDASGRFGCA